jgi:type II secretory pathway pseudopilin PulG
VARNALLGFALLAALAGCSSAGDEADAQAAEAQLAALRAHNDSLRAAQAATASASATVAVADTGASSTLAATTPGADSTAVDTAGMTEAEVADSIRKAREIEVMRETFAYTGGSRDPFASLLNTTATGPEIGSLDLVGVYQDLRNSSNSVVVLRDKGTAKRYKLRVGDQVGRARLVQIRPRDAVFTIRDFGYERQETLSLRKQEVETP